MPRGMPRARAWDPAARAAWPHRAAGGSVAAPRHREGDLRVQQLGARLLELVQGSCLGDRQQPQRRVVRAGLVLALCGEERTLCPAPRIGRQFDGALVKCRPRRQAASRPRSAGRALQLGGDVLVEPGRRVRAVPGAAIGVDVGIGGLRPAPGERAGAPPALPRASPPNARADDRSAPARRNRPVPRRRPAQPRPARCRAPRPPATPTPDPPAALPRRREAKAASRAAAAPAAP